MKLLVLAILVARFMPFFPTPSPATYDAALARFILLSFVICVSYMAQSFKNLHALDQDDFCELPSFEMTDG